MIARNFVKFILGPTLIDRSALIRGRTELWLGLFDFSGHSAYDNSLKKSIETLKNHLSTLFDKLQKLSVRATNIIIKGNPIL
jgi:hypothetical protein